MDVALDEVAVEAAGALDLGGNGEGQHDVGAGAQSEVGVGLFGELDPFGVDDHDPRPARPLGAVDQRHEVEIGVSDVVSPHHDQARALELLRRQPWRLAEGSAPGPSDRIPPQSEVR